ncbi:MULTISPECIES: hypothetical protein [Pseudodesulfovibrio]|uniref:DNA methylase N-4/N-6 domain-containing protein n=1 Tax=Pseudodesulfovibrio aespoeensis (strain ATCC 700646 / DSM 10631 / Aspo-2) TaxID=643562 RepID=E6VVH7_PSEA9|nr:MULTISPECIES: hypothetical protein [Pseudodesulfovibrio]ADU63535.1 hypothetical protein Daes_2533 [Pseudodesulfovibrio aespoeensis Aspo-2]MBV1765601.1 site-specific DNA-methyltransferase [Pseudodesulfovibrio sp.]MCG2733999.1 site-specific DNA-methyltransferase [Pseudodesulfovibrio aespoeensis]
MQVTFEEWTQGREVPFIGTNAGAQELPFQNWRRFKEAFAPELISKAIVESERTVERCLDPFGGSGTTALACQFLGVYPTTVEVNPFLADLIEAKLSKYDCDKLANLFGRVVRSARSKSNFKRIFEKTPPTFVEPGVAGRWIFDRPVAERIAAYLTAIDKIAEGKEHRLFRILLSGILIRVSNVMISGKGRRYRKDWEKRYTDPALVDRLFEQAVRQAIVDIHRYSERACCDFELTRGDCREVLRDTNSFDLAVFSPPYPNSFDYTDVYNVELWVLGYLKDPQSNKELRESTLTSHVQVARKYALPPATSILLENVLDRLNNARSEMWSKAIPDMVGAYFSDMSGVISTIEKSLAPRGELWMVVGDSQYAGIHVNVADILCELSIDMGFSLEKKDPFRSMRSSAQQGGRRELAETLIVLKK